ncbi:MAG: mannose-1-phosphate guanylyltransferase [Bacteroidales bacterium]|nr:mannose-1-phosphate guanylyltransferase [Bacteroidales bacterium]
MDTHVVIMAGGIGSRLWPVSTPETPKQFIDLLGVGRTMIQMTVDRFLPVCKPDHFWVVTSAKYVATVRQQLPEIPEEQILAEPEARNTAPCIAYATWKIAKKFPDANIVVTPADALVLKTELFADVIGKALAFTQENKAIVTVGISPSRPATGYGYICALSGAEGEVRKVSSFTEKPNLETAKDYLAQGNYFWNAGIFVWRASVIMEQIRLYAPAIAWVMDRIEPSLYTPEENVTLFNLFPTCEKISIDYAVMERTKDAYVISADLGWSDLGSWGSLKDNIKAEGSNSVVGDDVRLFNCQGCIVEAADAETVVLEGLKDYAVAVSKTADGGVKVLVCRLSEEQRIKDFSAPKS